MVNEDKDTEHPLIERDDDARTLLVSMPLNSDGPLTPEEKDGILSVLAGYMARYSLTEREVSRSVGSISEPVICDIRNGKYDHTTLDKHLRAINAWMEVDAKRRAGTRAKKALTTTYVVNTIRTAVNLVRQNATMGYVCGPAGIGKTVTIEEIVKRDPGCVHIAINTFNRTRNAMLNTLCDRLNVGRSVRRKDLRGLSQFDRLRTVLDGTHRLLLFDDADKLPDNSLETLREIHDAFGVPILLVGVVDVAQRIRQSTDSDHGQLESRFGVKLDIRKLCAGKKGTRRKQERPIFTRDDIRKIFDLPGLRLVDGAVDYLFQLANMDGLGGIRRCEHLVYMAARVVRRNQKLTTKHLARISARQLRTTAEESDVMQFDESIKEAFTAPAAAAKTA